MVILDDIGAVLTNASVTGGATGWRLEKGMMTDTQDQTISVMEGVARPSGHEYPTGHDYPSVQVLIRGAAYGYAAARAKSDAAIAALNNVTIAGYVYVLLRSAPLPLGLDAKHRPMISVNFDMMTVRS